MRRMPIKLTGTESEKILMQGKNTLYSILMRPYQIIIAFLKYQIRSFFSTYSHMKEHEKDNFVDFSKMTQPQIIMHHFRQFDQNKDGKVDGLEIFKKIQMENGKQYFWYTPVEYLFECYNIHISK